MNNNILYNTNFENIDTVKQLVPLFKALHNLLITKKFLNVDIFLESLDVQHMSIVTMVGFLRVSSTFKTELSNWNIFLKQVNTELINRNVCPEKKLNGLLNI